MYFAASGRAAVLSDKYDITKAPRYKMLSDYDKRNAFDMEKYRKRKKPVVAKDEVLTTTKLTCRKKRIFRQKQKYK